MHAQRETPAMLRAKARRLATVGLALLAIAFPATLIMVACALYEQIVPPFLPALVGAPPILLGYLACHVSSRRMVKAMWLERMSANARW